MTTGSLCGHADLLKVMEVDPELVAIAAELSGMRGSSVFRKTVEVGPFQAEAAGDVLTSFSETQPVQIPEGTDLWPRNIQAATFWRPVRYWQENHVKSSVQSVNGRADESWKDEEAVVPVPPPICQWAELLPRLRKGLLNGVFSRTIDVDRVVRKLANAEILSAVPRRTSRRWNARVQVIVDKSSHLIPFRTDQQQLCQRRS